MSDAPILDLVDATVRYGSRTALDKMTARVEGGAVGLLGPNGAGKSSLIKALLGLVPMASGKALVLGHDIARGAALLRRRIGYMPEREAAFPGMTGFQATWYAGRLAGMPDADARRRAHEVLLFAGLEEARYRQVSTFSTGMRQRVKLAQALVHDPDLAFLDEPTNGLDPKGRTEMLELIKVLAHDKGIHVILSSHLLRDVEEVCDSVLVLRRGELARHAAIEDLRSQTQDACRVAVTGDADAFRASCERRGLTVTPRQRELELRWSDGADTQVVFAAARESDALIRSLRPVRITLEDALMDVLGGDDV